MSEHRRSDEIMYGFDALWYETGTTNRQQFERSSAQNL
jgi:hypothetical protein